MYTSSAGTLGPYIMIGRAGTDRTVTLVSGGDSATVVTDLAVDTQYRFHVRGYRGPGGNGFISLAVYTESDYTLQGFVSIARGWVSYFTLRFGAVPFVQNGEHFHYFDGIAVNDDHVPGAGDGIHIGDPGGGAVQQIDRPQADGTFTDFGTTGSANHFENVDEQPLDEATFNSSILGDAAPDQDSYDIADWGGRSNDVKSVAILFRHKSNTASALDFFHGLGFYDGANDLIATMTAVGNTWTWGGTIVDEVSGGGATSNAWYDGCEVYCKKTLNFSNFNAKDLSYTAVEAEDDDGVVVPAAGTVQRRRGSVV
jgi:hypothetical protein